MSNTETTPLSNLKAYAEAAVAALPPVEKAAEVVAYASSVAVEAFDRRPHLDDAYRRLGVERLVTAPIHESEVLLRAVLRTRQDRRR